MQRRITGARGAQRTVEHFDYDLFSSLSLLDVFPSSSSFESVCISLLSSVSNSLAASLKLLAVLPSSFPSSGSLLGPAPKSKGQHAKPSSVVVSPTANILACSDVPKIRAATPAITATSGSPSPKSPMHVPCDVSPHATPKSAQPKVSRPTSSSHCLLQSFDSRSGGGRCGFARVWMLLATVPSRTLRFGTIRALALAQAFAWLPPRKWLRFQRPVARPFLNPSLFVLRVVHMALAFAVKVAGIAIPSGPAKDAIDFCPRTEQGSVSMSSG